MNNIINTMRANGRLNKFLRIVEKTGHLDSLENCHTFTIIAPVDRAFERFGKFGFLERRSRDELLRFLKKHIIRGDVNFGELKSGSYRNMQGREINFSGIINKRQLVFLKKDIECENGRIHLVDRMVVG